MQGIFVTALYSYARTRVIPSAFSGGSYPVCFCPKTGRAGKYMNDLKSIHFTDAELFFSHHGDVTVPFFNLSLCF